MTSCTERCCAARSNVPISSGFSNSRPTSGVVYRRVMSVPKRERAALACQSESGSDFPLHRHRLQRLVLEHPARRPISLLPDRNPTHRRQPPGYGGRVHDIPGDEPLALLRAGAERHHRLTRVDPHPHL